MSGFTRYEGKRRGVASSMSDSRSQSPVEKIIWDLDDTMIPTEHAYVQAQYRLFEWMINKGGIFSANLIPYFEAQIALSHAMQTELQHRAPNLQTVMNTEWEYYDSHQQYTIDMVPDAFWYATQQIAKIRKAPLGNLHELFVQSFGLHARESKSAHLFPQVDKMTLRDFFNYEQELDSEAAKSAPPEFRFSRHRYPASLQAAYAHAAGICHVPLRTHDLYTVGEIGKSACEYKKEGCICGACPVHSENALTSRYFCIQGSADEIEGKR